MMQHHSLRNFLLLCVPIAVALVVTLKPRSGSLHFHRTALRYQGNTIEVRSQLDWRLSRPSWWPTEEQHYAMNLSFVSATIKDSSGNKIPADEISGGNLFPGDAVRGNEPTFERLSLLKPRRACDLSHGGTVTMQMQVQGKNPSDAALWQGRFSAPLPANLAFGMAPK